MIEFSPCSDCMTPGSCISNFQEATNNIQAIEDEDIHRLSLQTRPIEIDLVTEELVKIQRIEGCGYSEVDIEEIINAMQGKPVA